MSGRYFFSLFFRLIYSSIYIRPSTSCSLPSRNSDPGSHSKLPHQPKYGTCAPCIFFNATYVEVVLLCTNAFYFWRFARCSPAPVGLSRVLGCGARRGPAYTAHREFEPRAGSVGRALGVQSRAIWQVIMGLLSVELVPSKTMEHPHASCFAPLLSKLSAWWQPRYESSRTSSLCGPLLILCVYGHCICVSAVCYNTRACV